MKNKLIWGADAPLSDEPLFVNPMDIEWQFDDKQAVESKCGYAHLSCGRSSYLNSGRILDGDWDRYRKPVTSTYKYKVCFKHFIKGMSWQKTGIYDYVSNRIAERGQFDGCRTYDEILKRYDALDRLFEQVEKDGKLKLRSEMGAPKSHREQGGIYCHIGHDGQFLRYLDGNHRFVIARLLKLPEIPVRVGLVHKKAVADGLLLAHRARGAGGGRSGSGTSAL